MRAQSNLAAERKALRAAYLAEQQAIAIYEAEIAVLSRSGWTVGRQLSLQLCRDILTEERQHALALERSLPASVWLVLQREVSRWGGRALGLLLSLLPSRVSWHLHVWAERQAADIYERASRATALPALLEARDQEARHATLFKNLLQR